MFGRLTALAGVFSLVLAAVIAAVGMVAWAWRAEARRQGDVAGVPELDRLTDVLAGAVKDQWTRAAADRGLLEPEPIPVRWRKPSLPFAGPVSAAVGSQRFAPLPGMPAVSQQRLRAGKIRDLHAVYGGLGSGRLVIVGAPGSGKSGAAVLLVLAALKHREQVPDGDRPRVPVPVMFTLHGWDPNAQRAQDWLAGRLQQTYLPLFAGKSGAEKAARLLAAGKVAVLLDGLDEIPEVLRPVVLRALSQQAAFRVVVLTRSAEMAAAATQDHLEGAAALELEDIDPVTAVSYLRRVQLDPPPRGWRELTDYLRHTPDSPIAQALNSPLTLTLVRDTYRSGDDIRELLEFCIAAGHHFCRDDIVDHLLDRVLLTAYAQRPGDPPLRYDLQTAQRALGDIAARMNQDGTRDLQWWRIAMWAPVAPRVIATGLLVGPIVGLVAGLADGLAAGIGAGLANGLIFGLAAGLMFGLAAGLAAERGRRSPQRIARMRWRRVSWRDMLPSVPSFPSFRSRLVSRLATGFMVVASPFLVYGLLVALPFAFPIAFAFGLAKGFSQPDAADTSPLSPLTSWRSDRAYGLLSGLVTGLTAGLLVFGLTFGLGVSFAVGAVFGLGFLLAGLVFGLAYVEAWSASLASAQLAARWHTPVHLMRFLEDARDRNVLRTVGPVYQFRHARLQDRLAAQASPAKQNHGQPH